LADHPGVIFEERVQLFLLGIRDLIAGGKRGRVMPEIVDWREPP